MLSLLCWDIVQSEVGGVGGHNLNLMSLDSNTHLDKSGSLLRHFTSYPTPHSSGVNVFNQDLSICDGVVVNAYVLPPISLIFLCCASFNRKSCCHISGSRAFSVTNLVANTKCYGSTKGIVSETFVRMTFNPLPSEVLCQCHLLGIRGRFLLARHIKLPLVTFPLLFSSCFSLYLWSQDCLLLQSPVHVVRISMTVIFVFVNIVGISVGMLCRTFQGSLRPQ